MPDQTFNGGGDTTRISPKWPRFPADGDHAEVREYLTAVINGPGLHLDRAVRLGPYVSSPVVLWVRDDGPNKDVPVRFEQLADVGKPATLRAALAAATKGRIRMRQPTVAQAGDFQLMVCRLADLLEQATVADETADWLDEYLARCRLVTNHSLDDPEQRYDALQALRSVPEFDRVQAGLYVRRELPPEYRPAMLLDCVTSCRWIRTGELVTYLRHVYGERISQSSLNARMRELGVDRVVCEVNRPGLTHQKLVMYRVQPLPLD